MANLIQVKRSTTNATPAALTAGELAYSFLNTSNSLFIGNTSAGGPIRIAGGNYAWLYQSNTGTPGALTANAVVITNGNSFVTNWKTNALTVGVDGATVSIANIATFSNTTQLGNAAAGSNTELVTSWAIKNYIDNNAAKLPNTYVSFGSNNVANGGTSGFTFDSTNLILSIGNTTVNTQISQTAITTTATVASGNVNITGTANASVAWNVGANVNASTTQLNIGNTISNAVLNQTSLNIGTATSNVAINSSSLRVGNTTSGTINAFALNISGVTATGNTTVTGFVNASSYGTFGGVVNATSFNSTGTATSTFANNVTITGVANVVALNSTGAVTSTFANNVTVAGVTNTSSLNVSGVTAAGNTTVTGFVNVSSYGTFGGTVNAAALNVSGVIASGNTTHTGFVNVSTYGTFGGTVNAAALNISGVVTTGNTTHTGFVNVSSYGTFGAQVNATSFNSTGATTSTFANNVTVTGVVNATSINVGDLSVSGNLTVSGTLTTVSANNLTITDSLIQLASNNNVSDVLAIGLYGNYGPDANTNNHRHTGLYRDPADGVWKLFTNLLPAPTTTIDSTNSTYTIATLKAHLSAGGAAATGLIANATTIAITANATLNVAIVANTLSLSTALPGTSGGTGLNTYATQDLLVANATNGFSKLSVGTEGYILQVSSGLVAWNTLDGGSF